MEDLKDQRRPDRSDNQEQIESSPAAHSGDQAGAQADSARSRVTRYRWVIIGLGFLITLINYMDRSAIAYAVSPLKAEFGINDEGFGRIAAAFGIGYMVMTFGGGLLVDRFGTHKIWSGAALLWSGCTALMGTASSVPMLLAIRTMLGIAEGPHFPALTRVVADWLPANERGRATAMGLAAVPLANVIGAPLLAYLVTYCGWKTMFVILGSLGVAWAILWLVVFRDYPESCKRVSDAELRLIREGKEADRQMSAHEIRARERSHGKTTWAFMFFNPALMSNNLAFFAFGYLVFFALTWLPAYLEQTYGLNIKQAGWFAVAPWLTAAILMSVAGWLSDWLYRKTGSLRASRSHLIWICQLLSALSFIPLMFTHRLELAIVMISLGIGIGLMPNAAFYALNCDLAKDRAATSLGIMDCFFALAGIIAPYMTGLLAAKTGSFSAAFGLLIFFSLVAVVSVLCFQRPDSVVAEASSAQSL